MSVPQIKPSPGHQAEDEGNDLRRGRDCAGTKVMQIAPPRKPVTRIAPRTAVCGMAYRIAQIKIMIAKGVAALSAKPVAQIPPSLSIVKEHLSSGGDQGERHKSGESATRPCASHRMRIDEFHRYLVSDVLVCSG